MSKNSKIENDTEIEAVTSEAEVSSDTSSTETTNRRAFMTGALAATAGVVAASALGSRKAEAKPMASSMSMAAGSANFSFTYSTTEWGIQDVSSSDWYVHGSQGAETSLYYNGSEKLKTTSDGVEITGDGMFSGPLNVTSSEATLINLVRSPAGSSSHGLGITFDTAHSSMNKVQFGAAGPGSSNGFNWVNIEGGQEDILATLDINGDFAAIGGGLFGDRSSVTGTGTGVVPTFDVINTSVATFVHSINCMSASLTSGQNNIIMIGKSGSTKNSGYFGYNWVASGSNSNYISLGHWGSNHLMKIFGQGNVEILGTCTATDFTATSDRSLKNNFQTIENPLERLLNLKGYIHGWKAGGEDSFGFIHDEVEASEPLLSIRNDEGLGSVNYQKVVPLIVEAARELEKRAVNAEEKNAELNAEKDKEIAELKARLEKLEKLLNEI